MSLESKIETLTASVNRLIEALGNERLTVTGGEGFTVTTDLPEVLAAAEAATKAKADKPKKAKAEPKPEPADEPAPEMAKDPLAKTPVTSTQVAQALVALMKDKGRDAGVAVLQQFGASKVPEIKAEDYPKVLAAIKAAS